MKDVQGEHSAHILGGAQTDAREEWRCSSYQSLVCTLLFNRGITLKFKCSSQLVMKELAIESVGAQPNVGLKCNWNLPTAGRAYSCFHRPDAIDSAASSRVGRTGATQFNSTRPIGVGNTRPAPTAQARPLCRRTSVFSTNTPPPLGAPVCWPPATVVGRNRSIYARSNHHHAWSVGTTVRCDDKRRRRTSVPQLAKMCHRMPNEASLRCGKTPESVTKPEP